ncbi:MAG TPA: hypothetical protein VHN14_27025 [Kofleriaceae bacterium]|jgi:hypothetical protein|nr:hypothetical protein [Kofleriaceae bacterium]
MPVRKMIRKNSNTPARIARRRAPAPRFTRIEHNIDVVVPLDCDASVIFKQVAHDDEHRYYAWWLLVGRYDRDALTVSYKHTGEDSVRCDIPNGTPLCAAALQPHLAKFLKSEGVLEGAPPIIGGTGK